MKKYTIFFCFLIVAFVLSCEKTDKAGNITLLKNNTISANGLYTFSESSDLWEQAKQAHQNSYIFSLTTSSWVGIKTITQFEVDNGEVTKRTYIRYMNDNSGNGQVDESWEETSSELGSHTEGAQITTIDELYSTCLQEYISVNAEENAIYFDTMEEGIMMKCGYVSNGCMDDCYVGFHLSYFEWTK